MILAGSPCSWHIQPFVPGDPHTTWPFTVRQYTPYFHGQAVLPLLFESIPYDATTSMQSLTSKCIMFYFSESTFRCILLVLGWFSGNPLSNFIRRSLPMSGIAFVLCQFVWLQYKIRPFPFNLDCYKMKNINCTTVTNDWCLDCKRRHPHPGHFKDTYHRHPPTKNYTD